MIFMTSTRLKRKKKKEKIVSLYMYSCTIQALILYSIGTTLLQKASSAFA